MDGLARRVEKLEAIVEVAKAMADERDLDRLLALVVREATSVVESERSTLFLYDRDKGELWSKVAEGTGELRFPARTGLAGAVVATGEVVNIADAYDDPRFNRQFDHKTGFRTRSLLTVPMRTARGEIVGALQTLNKKDGTPFTPEDSELLLALGGVAAAAITNVQLHEEIERLFEGFANAAVVAIESRDPTTAGHSGRVAEVTIGLARAVDRGGVGRWKDRRFSSDELRELRYAALLHDFGKVGVREHVLVKANKLYPWDMTALEERFETIRRSLQAASGGRLLAIALEGGPSRDQALDAERRRLAGELAELDGMLEFVRASNRPTVVAEGTFQRLEEIARRSFEDSRGVRRPFLTEGEVRLLSIRKGSLADAERLEIESHVTHTYNFLARIPWTRNLKAVPLIAYGHHEKLTGRGYPRSLTGTEIPVQTRMITISDIYDALTASDRPYKPALPHERALDILHDEAKRGELDPDLLQVFVEADVVRLARAG